MSDHKQDLRHALGRFATGITVVTVAKPEGVHGMTANSFTSVSLAPPQILVCVAEMSWTRELLHAAGRFGVTILGENQRALSEYFAFGPQEPAAAERLGIRFRHSERGTPLLEGGLTTLDCRVASAHLSGDHTIFVGEVEEMSWADGAPLIYFEGKYRKLS